MKPLIYVWIVCLAGCAATPTTTPEQGRVAVDSYTLLAEIALAEQRLEEATALYLEAALASEDPDLAERTARMAHRIGLTEIGHKAVARWRELAPDDDRSAWFAGVFQTRSGRLDAAVEEFSNLITGLGQDNWGAGLALVLEALAAEPGTGAATTIMTELTRRFPGTAEGHFGLARLAMRSGDFDLALTNAEAAAELVPDWLEAKLLYARTLLVAGRTEDGLALARKLADEEGSVEVRLQYAELLLSSGESDEARSLLNEILRTNPGMPEAIRALAFLELTSDELESAKQHFGDLRGETTYRDEAFYYLGRIAETEGDFLQATRSYARVIEGTHAVEAQIRTASIMFTEMNDPDGALRHLQEFGSANPDFSTDMLLAESQLLLRMGETDEAMRRLDDAVAANPTDAGLRDAHIQFYIALTQNAINRDALDEAEQWINQGLARYPGDIDLRYSEALFLQEAGRLRKAVNVLEALVQEQPDNPALLNALGYLLADKFDRHIEARGYIQRALAMDPDSAAIIDSMGWVLFRLGDYEAALDYLERAHRLMDDPEVVAHLVDVHWALGQHAMALEMLQQALREAPDDPHLQEVSQRLTQ